MIEMSATIEISTLQGGRAYQQDAANWARGTDRDSGTYCARHHQPYEYITAVVADGTGSGAGSDVIANSAATIAPLIVTAYGPGRLTAAVNATADVVRQQNRGRGSNDNTTIVLATVDPWGAVDVAWAGDSRAYVLTRNGRIHRLTKDHNLGGEHSNILTRSLLGYYGHNHQAMPQECSKHEPESAAHDGIDRAERVLLCTDGVCGALTDDEIRHILATAPNARRAARRLTGQAVRRAAELGAKSPDNATALVIDLYPRTD